MVWDNNKKKDSDLRGHTRLQKYVQETSEEFTLDSWNSDIKQLTYWNETTEIFPLNNRSIDRKQSSINTRRHN